MDVCSIKKKKCKIQQTERTTLISRAQTEKEEQKRSKKYLLKKRILLIRALKEISPVCAELYTFCHFGEATSRSNVQKVLCFQPDTTSNSTQEEEEAIY